MHQRHGPLPLAAGTLLVQPPVIGFFGVTSVVGTATLPLSIPNSPVIPRLRLNCQGFVLDPGAADGFASTAGLEAWTL